MKYHTKEDILRLAEEEDVEFIRLQFTDIFGNLKNIAVTASQLQKALDNKCMFDGSSIEGFASEEESDMCLYPDFSTLEIFPWRPQQGKVARMICDVRRPDGSPFEGDPRYVLKRAVQEAEKMGYTFNVGPECEFFLFHTDENALPTTITYEQAGYFDMGPIDFGENARRDMIMTLEEMGFEIEASHHEAAPPQPKQGVCGSGMHINMSLFRDGKNIFCDESDVRGMSREAYWFIGGLMQHVKGMAAITNPLVNSYKRLVPGYGAPVYVAWSAKNRRPLIRIPASRGEDMRIELRSPDPSANPYLTLALCLMAGLDGIRNHIEPPESIDTNVADMSEAERKRLGIAALPGTLIEAIGELEKDTFVQEVLGKHISEKYIAAKKAEWQRYRSQVTEWEINEYLYKF